MYNKKNFMIIVCIQLLCTHSTTYSILNPLWSWLTGSSGGISVGSSESHSASYSVFNVQVNGQESRRHSDELPTPQPAAMTALSEAGPAADAQESPADIANDADVPAFFKNTTISMPAKLSIYPKNLLPVGTAAAIALLIAHNNAHHYPLLSQGITLGTFAGTALWVDRRFKKIQTQSDARDVAILQNIRAFHQQAALAASSSIRERLEQCTRWQDMKKLADCEEANKRHAQDREEASRQHAQRIDAMNVERRQDATRIGELEGLLQAERQKTTSKDTALTELSSRLAEKGTALAQLERQVHQWQLASAFAAQQQPNDYHRRVPSAAEESDNLPHPQITVVSDQGSEQQAQQLVLQPAQDHLPASYGMPKLPFLAKSFSQVSRRHVSFKQLHDAQSVQNPQPVVASSRVPQKQSLHPHRDFFSPNLFGSM